jgi:formamidase
VTVRFALDSRRPLAEQPALGHNRFHPEIPPVASVAPGSVLVVDTRDGIDGQIARQGAASGPLELEMERGHPMTGPFWVDGAEPGDILEVQTLDIVPDSFGFTVVRPGAGLLGEEIDRWLVVRWSIADGVARSEDLPGVTIPGAPFMGVMGVAPSPARLASFARREAALASRGGNVRLPDVRAAVPSGGAPARDGLRTVPPRETGGTLAIRPAGIGSRLSLPVDVPGALFSVGDAHFAQGDGECCSQAIEMHATAELRLTLHKGSELTFRPTSPTFEFTEPAAGPRRMFATTGVPVDLSGENHELDLLVAAKAALRDMVGYLAAAHGYSREQAYALSSVAVDLRISEVVNVPNALVSAFLPLDIFDEDGAQT